MCLFFQFVFVSIDCCKWCLLKQLSGEFASCECKNETWIFIVATGLSLGVCCCQVVRRSPVFQTILELCNLLRSSRSHNSQPLLVVPDSSCDWQQSKRRDNNDKWMQCCLASFIRAGGYTYILFYHTSAVAGCCCYFNYYLWSTIDVHVIRFHFSI